MLDRWIQHRGNLRVYQVANFLNLRLGEVRTIRQLRAPHIFGVEPSHLVDPKESHRR